MCGLAGYLQLQGTAPGEALLKRFTDLMHHRGPDGAGTVIDGPVGLAHTRLSILDLSHAAHQPMWDDAQRACVVFNGEIYNFRSIRTELQALGWQFRSTGDTEVLLKACLQWGVPAAARRFNGMFAIAFWDRQTQTLWLARDRMGIKPLHYALRSEGLYFSSEIKPLLAAVPAQPDLSNVMNVLAGDAPFWGRPTLFAGVSSLEPGCWAKVGPGGTMEHGRYFEICAEVDPAYYRELDGCTPEEIVRRLRDLMEKSVDLHMVSDAPLATLASGGLDSSVISTLACKLNPRLTLYHADVVGPGSERDAAQLLADQLGVKLVAQPMVGADYLEWLPQVVRYNEVPSAYHPNDVPFYMVSRAASRDGIKVVLTGEGADELFHGYESMVVRMGLRNSRAWLRRKADVLSRLPGIGKLMMMMPGLQELDPFGLSRGGVDVALQQRARAAYSFIPREADREVMVDGILFCHAHLLSLLHRNDRMGMMASLESRIPFLENEVIRFAVNLPARFKVPSNPLVPSLKHPLKNNKWALRQVARGLLPEALYGRKKMGFPVAPASYLASDAGFFNDGFLQETLRIQPEAWQACWNAGSEDFRWNALTTELWGRMFFRGADEAQLAAQLQPLSRLNG